MQHVCSQRASKTDTIKDYKRINETETIAHSSDTCECVVPVGSFDVVVLAPVNFLSGLASRLLFRISTYAIRDEMHEQLYGCSST